MKKSKLIIFPYLWIAVISISCDLTASVNTLANNDEALKTVSYGQVKIVDGKLHLGLWTRGDRPLNDRSNGLTFPEYTPNTNISFDIINCAGYLATVNGKSEYFADEKKYGLKLEIVPDTVSLNVVEKVKQCGPPSETMIFSQAFAITPVDEKRRTFKSVEMNEEELARTYKSLPSEMRTWTESGVFSKEFRQTKSLSKLSDDWADTDDDGKIDLVKLYGNCGEKSDSEYTCGRILRLINGNWLEIVYITPL